MTPAEAAKIIGCTSAHVRLLIRTGKVRHRRLDSTSPKGLPTHSYSITKREAERIRDERNSYTGPGRPRLNPKGSNND